MICEKWYFNIVIIFIYPTMYKIEHDFMCLRAIFFSLEELPVHSFYLFFYYVVGLSFLIIRIYLLGIYHTLCDIMWIFFLFVWLFCLWHFSLLIIRFFLFPGYTGIHLYLLLYLYGYTIFAFKFLTNLEFILLD